MSFFNTVTDLTPSIDAAYYRVRETTLQVNAFNANIVKSLGQTRYLLKNPPGTSIVNEIRDSTVGIRNTLNLLSGKSFGGNSKEVASTRRMAQNAQQNVQVNAQPIIVSTNQEQRAIFRLNETTDDTTIDWRVNISVPSVLGDNNELLSLLNGRLVFPFTPTITFNHSANYSQIQPVHTNYPFYAYENSQVDAIMISGDFVVESIDDAKTWIAGVYFLRSATKMFYGNGPEVGMPPVVCRLNGYGKHVLNNIPVVITNFTMDLPNDVDYMECTIQNEKNYVPVMSTISVQCAPNYARRSHSRFDLTEFAKGNLVGNDTGFI